LAQADGLHDSRNVRLHTLGFRDIKVHPLRSYTRRGDRPEWQKYYRQAGISSVATSAS
jgi:hypothetical protein